MRLASLGQVCGYLRAGKVSDLCLGCFHTFLSLADKRMGENKCAQTLCVFSMRFIGQRQSPPKP